MRELPDGHDWSELRDKGCRIMSEPQRDCPECKTALKPIQLLDYCSLGSCEMKYGEPSFLGLPWAPQGKVRGLICPTCHRIQLYGVPNAQQ